MEGTRRRSTRNVPSTDIPDKNSTNPLKQYDEESDTTGRETRTISTLSYGDKSRSSHDPEAVGHDDNYAHTVPGRATDEDLDPLGKGVKEVTEIFRDLERLGLQQYDITLPRCIVLGQQSSGKSSVIEAISGIKTPRDTDTCTCCPLYINMRPSDNINDCWKANVSLKLEYDLHPESRGTKNTLFPGWIRTNPKQIPFKETNSPEDLDNIIRAAQMAILNPLEDPQSFLVNSRSHSRGQHSKFSPNTVCIDVTEPGSSSLSFFDLPGLISQAETEDDDYTVDLVTNLVREYVREPDTLILVTCDLGTDIANSTASRLAREYNATGRCVGVLTKPDLLAPGTTDASLANVLDGKSFKLGHQYFVVKNSNKEEIQRGVSHRDARISEEKFFQSGRWSKSLGRFNSRFGTARLHRYAANQLAKLFSARMPEIRQQILTKINEVEEELNEIPVTPAHSAVRVISDIVADFCSEVRYEMEGEHDHMEWRNTWQSLQESFHKALTDIRPTMTINGQLDRNIYKATLSGSSAKDAFVIDSESEQDGDGRMCVDDVPATPSTSRKRKYEETTPVTPSKKPQSKTPSKRLLATPSKQLAFSMPNDIAQYKRKFVLDEVVFEIEKSAKGKMPGQIHPKVRDAMVLSPLQAWNFPIELFFGALQKELLKRMRELFNKHYEKRNSTELYSRSWQIVELLLHNNIHQQKTAMAEEALHDELEGPYLFHGDFFNSVKNNVRKDYRGHRLEARFKRYLLEAAQHLGRELSANEQEKVRKDKAKMAVIEMDPYSSVIDLIAEVSSYYTIATQRLHDSICMRVESKFFKQLRTQLREEIETGLGIVDDEQGPTNAQRLLAESSERERRRQELLARQEGLKKCLDKLNNKCRDKAD